MNNRVTEAKKIPDTEVNDRIDEKKVQYRKNEVKNRTDGRKDERKKKIHQLISLAPMAIYNHRNWHN